MSWQIPRRLPSHRQRATFIQRVRQVSFLGRIDGTLLILVLLTGLVIGGGWLIAGEASHRALERSSPPVEPVSDLRILTNFRDDLPERSLLDAVMHQGELAIAQQGRTVHAYNPATQLWDTETAFNGSTPPVAEDFVQLGGSGGVLWARGDDSSLAVRDDTGWSVVISNTRFVDPYGEPVPHDQLTAAAVLDDHSLLALGTDGAGLGLYDIAARRWHPPLTNAPRHITHLKAWRGEFYAGTSDDGLYRITRDGTTTPIDSVRGTIRDMDVQDDRLFVVERYGCVEDGEGCLRLLRFDAPGSFSAILDERNNYAELNPQVLHFAQDWGSLTTFAGQNGVYQYDMRSRGWEQLYSGRVGLIQPLPADEGFYFEAPRSLGLARPGQAVQTWDLPTRQPLKSLTLFDGRPLALAQDGGLYTVTDEDVQTVRSGGGFETNPDGVTRTIAANDSILFLHGDGAVLHDARKRTYTEIDASNIPIWLQDADKVIKSNDTIFVTYNNDLAEVYAIPEDDMADTGFVGGRNLLAVEPYTLASPVQSAWIWDTDALGVVGGDGSIHRIAMQSPGKVTGEPLSQSPGTLVDVASVGNQTVFASSDRLLWYDMTARSWSTSDILTDANERIKEILVHDGQVQVVTDTGRLLDNTGAPVITASRGQTYDTNNMSDAWGTPNGLYTAGNGRVERYDVAGRAITDTWQFASSGDVSLRGILNETPLTQVRNQAFLGDRVLAPNAGDVVSVSHDDSRIWTVRDLPTHRYLMGQRIDNVDDRRCFFRRPSPSAEVLDAARLPDGTVAAATTTGLQFYRPDARTWVESPDSLLQPERVFHLGDALLLTRDTAFALLPLADIELPASCEDTSATITPSLSQSVRALAVDPPNLRFAWLNDNGNVIQWQNGTTTELLQAPGTAPEHANLRRVYDRNEDGYLLFTTSSQLWRYDITRRTWQQIKPLIPGGVNVADMQATFNGSAVTIQVQGDDNRAYQGTFNAVPQNVVPGQITMQPLEPPATAPSSGTLDVTPTPTTPSPTMTPLPPPQPSTFNVGDVTFQQDADGINATLDGSDAFTQDGFIWDNGRRALAFGDNGLLLQSDAGIHPVDELVQFDTRTTGMLVGTATSGIFTRNATSGSWQERQNNAWVSAENPILNRELLSDDIWRWELQDGDVNVTLNGDPYNFALTQDGFTADRLQAAASYDGQLIITTAAFTETAAPDLLVDYQGARQTPEPADRYEVLHFADSSKGLFAINGGSIRQWDGNTFAPITSDPFQQRALVTHDHLRMTLTNGTVQPELRVDAVGGGSSWVPFAFYDRRWPFDVVTSAGSYEGTLYVGTLAGLQVYPSSGRGLPDASQVVDFRGTSSGALSAVERVGVPASAPNKFMARGNAACYQRQQSTGLVPCADTTQLDTRLRIDTPFWQWTLGDTLVGRYKDSAGNLDRRTISIVSGRLPHDRITDGVFCNGETLLLGANGSIRHHAGSNLSLNNPVQTHFVNNVDELRCFTSDVRQNNATLPAGAYARGTQPQRYTGTGWEPLNAPDLGQILRDYQEPPYDRARLRYRDDTFQQRTLTGAWDNLDWQFDQLSETWRLALDDWQHVLSVDGQLWAATSEGWMPFSLNSEGEAIINPDMLLVVRDQALQDCAVSDARADGITVTLRCNGDPSRVFSGTLDGSQDTNVFTPQANDPFAGKVLIDNALWQWQLEGRVDGARGTLNGMWQGEAVSLTNGHFAWDMLTAVAFFSEGLIDLTTEGAGWFTLPRDDLTLSNLGRPEAGQAATLRHVHVSPDDLLCLEHADGDYLRFNAAREFQDRTADCAELLDSDTLWTYTQTDKGLRIPDRGADAALRRLEAGRFTDDRTLGLPVYQAESGRYWLPTAAGVTAWDTAYRGQTIQGGNFPGLPAETPPTTLLMDDGQPLYMGADGLYSVETQALVHPLDFSGLDSVQVTGAALEGMQVQVNWQGDAGAGFSRFDLTSDVRQDNTITYDTRELSAYVENRQRWDAPAPELVLRFEADVVEARFAGRTRSFTLPDAFSWQQVVQHDETVYLLGRDDLLHVALNRLLYTIMQ